MRIIESFKVKQVDRHMATWIKRIMWIVCFSVFFYAYMFKAYRCMAILGATIAMWTAEGAITRRKPNLYIDILAMTITTSVVDTLFLSGELGQVGAFLALITAMVSVFLLGLFWGNILGIFNCLLMMVTLNLENLSWIREIYSKTFCERFPYILICFFASAVFLQYGITQNYIYKKNYRDKLERLIGEGKEEQARISLNILLSIFKALSTKSPEVGKHCEATAEWTRLIAKEMEYSPEECKMMYYAGLLHDIGKIGVAEQYWYEKGMSEEQSEDYYKHIDMGYQIVDKLNLQMITDAVAYHHETCNGRGYKGYKRYEIPEAARIVALADYLAHLDHKETDYDKMIKMIGTTADTKYDGDVVAKAVIILKRIQEEQA